MTSAALDFSFKGSPASKRSALFNLLEDAAVNERRCPTNTELRRRGFTYNKLRELVDDGLIKVEVYGRNWRVIQLMTGGHKNCRTAECPHTGTPYKVMGG